MHAEERRLRIRALLGRAEQPVPASRLAERFGVSRQIIVSDIALLRAAGDNICATPRGYLILRERGGILRRIACRHTPAQTADELNAIVDQGCTAVDVIVEHPVYGQLTGPLQISNRHDVELFLAKCAESDAQPLSTLTEGVHLHTLSCPDDASFRRVTAVLRALGILIEN